MPVISNIQHIFVGMDDEHLSDPAIAAALQLGKRLDAEVKVIHAMSPKGFDLWLHEDQASAAILAKLLVDARENRLAHLQCILNRQPETRSTAEDLLAVKHGKPATTLLEFTASVEQALIVIGPHRHRRLFDFGGTSREILSAASCPVWMQPGAWAPIHRILTAVDLSAGSAEVVATATRLATQFDAELTVLHVFQPPMTSLKGAFPDDIIKRQRQHAEERFSEFLTANMTTARDYQQQMLDGVPAEVILEQQELHNLIVMGSHGQSIFEKVMLGSEAYGVLKDAARPVMLVPQRRQGRLGRGKAQT